MKQNGSYVLLVINQKMFVKREKRMVFIDNFLSNHMESGTIIQKH